MQPRRISTSLCLSCLLCVTPALWSIVITSDSLSLVTTGLHWRVWHSSLMREFFLVRIDFMREHSHAIVMTSNLHFRKLMHSKSGITDKSICILGAQCTPCTPPGLLFLPESLEEFFHVYAPFCTGTTFMLIFFYFWSCSHEIIINHTHFCSI